MIQTSTTLTTGLFIKSGHHSLDKIASAGFGRHAGVFMIDDINSALWIKLSSFSLAGRSSSTASSSGLPSLFY
jgi:hypothetical protein